MYTDAAKTTGNEETMAVLDVVQLLDAALDRDALAARRPAGTEVTVDIPTPVEVTADAEAAAGELTVMGVDPAVLGKALASRLADIAAAVDRYDGFAFSEAAGAARRRAVPTIQAGAARDLALAALRAAGDPLSYAMLQRMAGGDTPLGELGRATGLPRLAVWERVNGLVAAGLAGRRHEDDSAGLTPAGSTLVELVEGAVGRRRRRGGPVTRGQSMYAILRICILACPCEKI